MSKKSLAELEEEGESLEVEISVAKQRQVLRAIDQRMGEKGGWKLFSTNGKLSGFNIKRAIAWLRTH